jgi:hypothetical protein
MYCRICGDESGVEFRGRSRMALCESCHTDTPRKVSREEFDRVFWGTGPEAADVHESTRREFYDDYRTSTYGTAESYRDRDEARSES